MIFDLAFIWALLIAIAVLAYVLLDGFDLGIGILFIAFKNDQQRDIMTNSVAPFWDGNETWLVLGGGGLLAAFPLAYAVVMPALYGPVIAMLLALIFRGVAFEFRHRSRRNKQWWDRGFAIGSLAAAFAQGVMLGALVQGVAVENRAYAGGWFDWATPFSLMTGIALAVGYALLGACWLILKTEGALQDRARGLAKPLSLSLVALIGGVSLWTPLHNPAIFERWFSWPALLYTMPVPALVAGCMIGLWRGVARHRHLAPFLYAEALFLLSYIGLGISLYPYIVPFKLSIWDAAAPDESLGFLLVGAAILLPVILGYTAYVYWVFRGKVDPEEGYH